MLEQLKVKVGDAVMMKSGHLAIVTKVVDESEYLGDRLVSIEVMYSNGESDSCSAWRVKEVVSGQA
jgi:preprotein translocase subunit YajC